MFNFFNVYYLSKLQLQIHYHHLNQFFCNEVEEVLCNKPKFRFVEKGEQEGKDVYLALGQTDAGRYLAIIFIYKPSAQALILSARDMANKERKLYERN